MTPTQRSVAARLRNKSFEGGWKDDSLWKAMKMRILPKTAVIENRILQAETMTLASSRCDVSLVSSMAGKQKSSARIQLVFFIVKFTTANLSENKRYSILRSTRVCPSQTTQKVHATLSSFPTKEVLIWPVDLTFDRDVSRQRKFLCLILNKKERSHGT